MPRKPPAAPPLLAQNVSVGDLTPYAKNARTHSTEQIDQLVRSIEAFGWTNPVLADAQGIVAGHGRVLAARKLYEAGKAIKLPSGALLPAGTVPVIDCTGWDEIKRRTYILADNELSLRAGWDETLLGEELRALKLEGADLSLVGYSSEELEGLLIGKTAGQTDPDDVPEPPTVPVSKTGDLWLLGRHRLLCGDSTIAEHTNRLFQDAAMDCILTDPPYCSGGNQEVGKSAGSIGSTMVVGSGKYAGGIANDRLSTRGYMALMKGVIGASSAPMLYAFTDWRMWINLFDVAESSGYNVRSLIVWDKGNPGMGAGWRPQHELIMFGAGAPVAFDGHLSKGNVIQSKRTGNPLHPTQKPVDLVETLLGVTDMAKRIFDPFGGSGTTLMACETTGRSAYLTELAGPFADATVTRWELFTGLRATLEGDGRTFEEVKAERLGSAAAPTAKPAKKRKTAK